MTARRHAALGIVVALGLFTASCSASNSDAADRSVDVLDHSDHRAVDHDVDGSGAGLRQSHCELSTSRSSPAATDVDDRR